MPTEAQKATEVAAAYEALKAKAVTQANQITALQAQLANGTPITADQLAALQTLDTLDTEVEAGDASPASPSSPAPSAS